MGKRKIQQADRKHNIQEQLQIAERFPLGCEWKLYDQRIDIATSSVQHAQPETSCYGLQWYQSAAKHPNDAPAGFTYGALQVQYYTKQIQRNWRW